MSGDLNFPIERNDSLYANQAQKFFIDTGYYVNGFARESARDIERLARSMPQGDGYWPEVGERVKRAVYALFSLPLAAAFLIPSLACYSLAACMGRGRFELVEPVSTADFWQGRSVKVMSLNACFQDPWSPLTGGVEPPLERIADQVTRVAAIVNAIGEEDPTVFCGQEFESLGAQKEFIRLMKEKGYRYFFRDLGSNDPIRNNSGLFAASKVPLKNVNFVSYPSEDRAGLAKWSNQGALTFTISAAGRELRFVDVHLNYGEGEENQNARNRQLKNHVMPLLNEGSAVALGDLNCNTANIDRTAVGFGKRFINALEGQVTCTDEGKHTLRGKDRNPGGQPCADCAEKIDGLLYDPAKVQVSDVRLKSLQLQGQWLSDHFATIATLTPIA